MTTDTIDVLIVGGGIFGLCSAYVCAKRGLSVSIVDAGRIGGGASGGVVGALAPYVPDEWNQKRAFQLKSLLSATDFWAEIDAISGLSSGYGRIGRVLPLLDERSRNLAE
jgi:glycine/D-amino acid oxidase-like deaminating enzyme